MKEEGQGNTNGYQGMWSILILILPGPVPRAHHILGARTHDTASLPTSRDEIALQDVESE